MAYILDPASNWTPSLAYEHCEGFSHVKVERRDLKDTRSGRIYQDGAFRVLVPGVPRHRLFKGETAWNDAARYAYDEEYRLQRASGRVLGGFSPL